MPTTYTHYAYGQDILRKLPDNIRRIIEPYEDYYSIGVHGPDILFYYRSFCKNRVNQYGVRVHNEPMRVFLEHAFSIYDRQPWRRAAFAWLAGFMTHYILDSTCHPYIRKRIKETGISHPEIERDWDSAMMQRDHLNPYSHLVARHIRLGTGYGSVIAPFFKMSPMTLRRSLFYMRLILNHLFRSTLGMTSRLAHYANLVFLRKMNYQYYFIKRSVNPGNIETISQLDKLYKDSQEECVQMITDMYYALRRHDRVFCCRERFERDFS